MTTRWAASLTSSGSPAMRHDPDGSWVSLDDYQNVIARAEAAEEALAGALANLADASRARGEAEGKLAASEMAGIVEGWRTVAENNSQMAQSWRARAEKAEAEADILRAAFRVNAIRWNPDISHAEIDKFVEKVASGDKVLL